MLFPNKKKMQKVREINVSISKLWNRPSMKGKCQELSELRIVDCFCMCRMQPVHHMCLAGIYKLTLKYSMSVKGQLCWKNSRKNET
jgi:hypothetical protein